MEKLRGVNFEWKDTATHSQGSQIGFIAQEIKDILPEVVDKKGEYYGISYGQITALLTEAIKELKAEIKELKAENKTLKNRIEAIETR